MKKIIMLALALCVAVVLSACGDDSDTAKKEDDTNNKEQESQSVEITDEEKVAKDDVVVQINGIDIKGERYNSIYAQTKMVMHQYGQDVSNTDKVKEQAINILIQQELLKQDAKKKGIEVSDEEINKEFNKAKERNGENFAKVLEKYGLTEETYKDQISYSLMEQKYIDQELTGIEVTDKEVQSFYDKLKEQSEDIADLKDIKPQIKEQLKQQKINKKLQDRVDVLREDAEIKNLI